MTDHETIASYFGRDHDAIDALLAAVEFADPQAALPRLAEFDRRLEQHIVWEEETLFPSVARVVPALEQGPIAVMKMEHVRIRTLKKEALDALRRNDGAAAKDFVTEMLKVLGPHNMKEEHVLYPSCDRFLSGSDTLAVLDKIKATAVF